MKVLFLNHAIHNCGVYQYGIRLYSILKKCTNIEYIYYEISSYEEYIVVISKFVDLFCIVYNYHFSTMPWLNKNTIQTNLKNVGIPHESDVSFFDTIINIDPSDNSNPLTIPRPLFEDIDSLLNDYIPSTPSIKEFIDFSEPNIPLIGSFGFGFDNKGFHKIIEKVNSEYDYAIIKLVIPIAHFDPNNIQTVLMTQAKCFAHNYKPNIKILITHEFFSNNDLLLFLRNNTINIFMYDTMYGRGISSTIDYALSVKVPIGISDSYMFRHIFNPSICLYNTSINNCINISKNICSSFNMIWNHNNLINKFKNIIQSL